jgi:hypothetical protein
MSAVALGLWNLVSGQALGVVALLAGLGLGYIALYNWQFWRALRLADRAIAPNERIVVCLGVIAPPGSGEAMLCFLLAAPAS